MVSRFAASEVMRGPRCAEIDPGETSLMRGAGGAEAKPAGWVGAGVPGPHESLICSDGLVYMPLNPSNSIKTERGCPVESRRIVAGALKVTVPSRFPTNCWVIRAPGHKYLGAATNPLLGISAERAMYRASNSSIDPGLSPDVGFKNISTWSFTPYHRFC